MRTPALTSRPLISGCNADTVGVLVAVEIAESDYRTASVGEEHVTVLGHIACAEVTERSDGLKNEHILVVGNGVCREIYGE